MRLLLDESIPKRLRRSLPEHAVRTVVEMGWSGVKNGKLLALAQADFDAFITVGKIVEAVAAGRTPHEVLADLPYLEAEDIDQALAYAARRATA